MTPDEYKQAGDLFEQLRELPETELAAALDEACADNAALRANVARLLAAERDPDVRSFLQRPAIEDAAGLIAPGGLKVPPPGTVIGNYRLGAAIGAGGMGVVLEAEDQRLGRRVAIKMLPMTFADEGTERIQRFQREARAASLLNHPNIVSIFDADFAQGHHFIVMEFVEGQTLRQHIASETPPDVRTILDWIGQAASALSAAAEAGIVHRDIKPENIMIRPDGFAKVLDFGLAKLRESPRESSNESPNRGGSPPADLRTRPGTLAGTIHYLSPEQVAGRPVGPQSDLFSLGVVAYELATGKLPFDGPTDGAIYDAILNRTPPAPSTLRPSLGTELDGLIMRALEKDPELRFQTAGDLRSSCRRLARDYSGTAIHTTEPGIADSQTPAPSSALGMAAQPAKSRRRRTIAAVACLMLALAAGFFWLTRQPPPRVTGITQITRDGLDKEFYVTDGPRLYYAAGLNDPSVRMFQIGSKGGDPVPMPRLTGMFPLDISPDRSEILLGQFPKGTPINSPSPIWIADTLGNTLRRVGGLMAEYACWSPDGKEILYASGSELRIAASDGSQSRLLLKLTGVPMSPAWSADGQSIRFLLLEKNSAVLWDVNRDGAGLRQVFPGWVNHQQRGGSWTPNGRYFVFSALRMNNDIPDLWETARSGGLFERARPVQLTAGPMIARVPRIGPDGRRVYFIGGSNQGELVRYDPKTRQWNPYLGGISAMQLDYSRDGQWVTWVSCPERSVWRSAVDGSHRLQLTPPIFAVTPRWSPDGTQIVFFGGPAGIPARVFIVPAAGGAVKELTHGEGGPSGDTDPSWSPDGTSIVFGAQSVDQRIGSALEILDVKTSRVSKLPGTKGLWSPRWSPDGRYVAALGFPNKLRLYELKSGAQTELTTFGAGFPAWSRDSQYLYFEDSATAGWYRVSIKDRKVERLASLTGLKMASPGLGWVGLAPDGSLISTRDAGSTEIYGLDWDAR